MRTWHLRTKELRLKGGRDQRVPIPNWRLSPSLLLHGERDLLEEPLSLLILPSASFGFAGTQTRFSQEPADQTVVAGQRAVLPCVLLNYSGIVQWTKDGLALGMGQGLKGEWLATQRPNYPIFSAIPHFQHRLLDSPSLSSLTTLLCATASPLSLLLSSISIAFPPCSSAFPATED